MAFDIKKGPERAKWPGCWLPRAQVACIQRGAWGSEEAVTKGRPGKAQRALPGVAPATMPPNSQHPGNVHSTEGACSCNAMRSPPRWLTVASDEVLGLVALQQQGGSKVVGQ